MRVTENLTPDALLNALEKEHGVRMDVPVDVEKIAKFLDISVEEYYPERPDAVGEICACDGKVKIRVNPLQNSYAPRRRFTVAHEIAHFVLHFTGSGGCITDTLKTMSRTDSYWDVTESEANAFAAGLLMPDNLIAREGRELINSYRIFAKQEKVPASIFIEQMAKRFEVSSKAMEYRLKNLRILPG